MTNVVNAGGGHGSRWRLVGWGIAVSVLILPFVAMRFTSEVNWTPSDFTFAAVLLGSVGLGLELAVRKSRSAAYRAGAAFALLASFLTIWVNGAVGMIGSEDNPYNLLFLGLVAAALIGSIAIRFRAAGMVWVMAAAAIGHGAIGIVGMFADLRGGILGSTMGGLWLLSAALFRNAAEDRKVSSESVSPSRS